jgi:Cdc6-like AAA superfamily ATPase
MQIGEHRMTEQLLLSKEEKIKQIDFFRIYHPDFKKALELISLCHKSKLKSADPQCLLITGNYGTGKTTISERYIKQNQKVIPLERTTKRAILFGSIPSPTKINTFLETMLGDLGDPYPVKGTIGNKQYRLVNLIKDSEVELIMLDEFQHFVHKENHKVNHEVADCFKSIINATKVPVVLLGLDESEKVLDSNGQLKRRFSFRHHLTDFSCRDAKTTDQFRILLHQIDKALPFERIAGLKESGMWQKFESATKGNMNALMKLIRYAALAAVEADYDQIKEEHFSKAFELHSFILNGTDPFK